jgi:mono/diheme cytochrome c family protein
MRQPVFLLLVISITFMSDARPDDFTDYSGQELYMRFCASCHGEEGHGDGPVASAISVTVPDLTGIMQRQGDQFPEQQLREIIDGRSVVIAHGTRYMPVWGYEFWVEQGADKEAEADVRLIVDNLLGYIRGIQR